MSKIKTKVSREANYVYHMLSVSKCGYNNEYGEQYSSMHSSNDLKILKNNEGLITVKGGVHCGEIYWPFIAIPASLDTEAIEFYQSFYDLFYTGKYEENIIKYFDLYSLYLDSNLHNLKDIIKNTYNSFVHLKNQIIQISTVMINNYEIYCSNVWEQSKNVLLNYSNGVQNIFDNDKICERLEEYTGIFLNSDFIVSFCNSIDGGAEAIDITKTQDIFGIGRDYEWAKKFILHEYVIYMLKQALFETTAFTDIKYWSYTESLAEFYLRAIIGETGMFTNQKYIIDYYKEEYKLNPKITPFELYESAIIKFEISKT